MSSIKDIIEKSINIPRAQLTVFYTDKELRKQRANDEDTVESMGLIRGKSIVVVTNPFKGVLGAVRFNKAQQSGSLDRADSNKPALV